MTLLLIDAVPALAADLEAVLAREGHTILAAQVRNLPLIDRCRCGDPFCATVYTAPIPRKAWGPRHETIALGQQQGGMINLDLLDGAIVSIEVLFRDDIRLEVLAACP